MALWRSSPQIPSKRRKYLWRTADTPHGCPVAWCRRGTASRWQCVFADEWSGCVGHGETRNQALADLVKVYEAQYGVRI